ncbi:hypothetical protein DID96_06680 [Burkholderia sp. Bp8963]|uniref:hypothetical protein n=1 Tax=Burkholderia sp. Bp8963 TaxID=2184547 RepID=UPI000F593716|nr:hypothetical protein [Burkholderia sp. Bp8963]RQS74525.1 hypothetical protein DID96_06680 [Burkholderia sp. Bp8963]
MRTRHIRLDAGQSHIAWFDKGSQVIVLDGALAVTLRHGSLDWLPDAPHYMRRVLDAGDCLTIETAGHASLAAAGAGTANTAVVEPEPRAGWRGVVGALRARLPKRRTAAS